MNLKQGILEQPQILVVDDESLIRNLMKEFFTKRSYQVLTAATPAEALEIISRTPPDLVILDILLQEEDGMELFDTIKNSHPYLPIIIMTGIGFEEDLLREAKEKGAAGYIAKTQPLDQLLMEVHRALYQYK